VYRLRVDMEMRFLR